MSRRASMALAAVALVGCSFSASFDTPPAYRLTAVGDEALPASPGFGLTIVSGTLQLNPEGDCLHSQRVRMGTGSDAQESTRTVACTWNRSGDTLELTIEPGEYESTMQGRFHGEALELTRDTGIRCVTTPCPAVWIESYVRDRG